MRSLNPRTTKSKKTLSQTSASQATGWWPQRALWFYEPEGFPFGLQPAAPAPGFTVSQS